MIPLFETAKKALKLAQEEAVPFLDGFESTHGHPIPLPVPSDTFAQSMLNPRTKRALEAGREADKK